MIRGIIFPPNGVSFRSKRYAKALRMLKIKHKRTKPDTPRTNGKASPSRPPRTGGGWPLDIQTSLRAWAYATPYTHSDDRRAPSCHSSTPTTIIAHTSASMAKPQSRGSPETTYRDMTARAGWVFMEPGTSETAFEPLREAAIAGSVLTHPALERVAVDW